jgi:Ni/Fe-hydrogenase subunit HybB-like protein
MNFYSSYATERRILTRPFFVLLALSLVGLFYIIVRFTKGIGAVSNLSDGYPWGIWVAYDVAIGTAIACGGYAVAVLIYIQNSWRYHPLVRSAILTTLFGSCLAASSVVVDIGRPWNAYGFFVPSRWQPTSALFELALCVAGYLVAQSIEFLPSILCAFQRSRPTLLRSAVGFLARLVPGEVPSGAPGEEWVRSMARYLQPRLNRVLIFIVVAGIVLPTMHQSTLGSLMLIASTKLHPLWHSPFLPLLFLINCIYIGFAIVIMESIFCSFILVRPYQSAELAALARLIPWLTGAWLVIRVADLVQRDQMSAVFHGDFYSGFFLVELFLMAFGSVPLFSQENRRSPRWLFISAAMMLLGGGLYRFNVYLIGFNPGTGWHYFPSFAEVMISVGIVSLEILGYQLLIKILPALPNPKAFPQALNCHQVPSGHSQSDADWESRLSGSESQDPDKIARG